MKPIKPIAWRRRADAARALEVQRRYLKAAFEGAPRFGVSPAAQNVFSGGSALVWSIDRATQRQTEAAKEPAPLYPSHWLAGVVSRLPRRIACLIRLPSSVLSQPVPPERVEGSK